MPTMNVSLTAEMAEFVEGRVASGDYVSASEVVRDALRMLRRDHDAERETRERLKRAVGEGIAEIERGEAFDGMVEDIARSVRRRLGA